MNTKPYRLIIVEGPDGAGKTTLVERMWKHLEAKGRTVSLQGHGPYLNNQYITYNYLRSIEMAADAPPTACMIMDRSWYSEPIYGQAMRGGRNRIAPADLIYLDLKALTLLNPLVILCLPPKEACLKAYAARREMEYIDQPHKLEAVWELYSKWFSAFYKLPKILYNYENDPDASLLLRNLP
jgi:ABC-type cobalamin/Fe3+-siderophores transport system ATPase subunit